MKNNNALYVRASRKVLPVFPVGAFSMYLYLKIIFSNKPHILILLSNLTDIRSSLTRLHFWPRLYAVIVNTHTHTHIANTREWEHDLVLYPRIFHLICYTSQTESGSRASNSKVYLKWYLIIRLNQLQFVKNSHF